MRNLSALRGGVMADMFSEHPPSADAAERAVEAWTVGEALGRLSQPHREILIACFYQGRSVAETAAGFGLPVGTVISRAHFALRSLKAVLEEMGVTR